MPTQSGVLRREVGLWGLTFVSLGSIIGSGWLLGALSAAQAAGPASLLSWLLAGAMLVLLALVHAELGATYPVAGGTARFPGFAFGALAGLIAGWTAWLQAVTIAPIEVEASLQYLDNVGWVQRHLGLLHGNGTLSSTGLAVATLLMLLFTVINLLGVRRLARSNATVVVWKIAIPVLTVVVVFSLTFHGSNFTAGGGFSPYGAHGVFAALPAGVVFSLQGFEQAIQLGGEARNPQRDLSRAVILAMFIGTVLYVLLQIVFIGGLDPRNLAGGWAHPVPAGDFGPYATIAAAAGAGWLAFLLYADAFVSPAGTGLVYLGTSARLSYALARQRTLPPALRDVSRRGVPLYSIMLAFIVGELAFLPYPSWQSLVGLVTSATAIMYAFAPVSLTALRRRDPQRLRPYRLPASGIAAPAAFVAANLLIYWGGFEASWKLLLAIASGLALSAITRAFTPERERPRIDWHASSWIWPWLIGLTAIGYLGRYGRGARSWLPGWIDVLVVTAFALIVFAYAVSVAIHAGRVRTAVDQEQHELTASVLTAQARRGAG
ncbi:APC family permease [Dactylosporangium sp. NPDC049140]|uniref:APC family permease n=1 Tax=Dactylosporangium sp. NPDC049140 TaxID=3155647 RepID=UPI0033FF9DB5